MSSRNGLALASAVAAVVVVVLAPVLVAPAVVAAVDALAVDEVVVVLLADGDNLCVMLEPLERTM